MFLLIAWILTRHRVNRLALNLFLFFIFTQAVSLISWDVWGIGQGVVRLEQYFVVGLFGVYIASLNLGQAQTVIFWALGGAITTQSLLAIAQFIKGSTLGFWILGERTFSISTPGIAKFDFRGQQFLRPYGTFPHPNVLAAFMVIIVLLLVWSHRQSRDSGIHTGFSILLAMLTTLITVSRTALVAGVFCSLVLLSKKWKLVFLIGVTILLPVFYTRFSSAFNFDALSLIRREEQSVVAFKLWLDYPLFGVGLNNFIPAASDQLLSGPSRFLQPVHNIFLLSLAETGLIGLSGFLILIGFPVFMLFKLRTKNYELRTLLLVWGIIIFLGLFDHYFLTLPQGYRLLFLVWGISLSSMHLFEKERKN